MFGHRSFVRPFVIGFVQEMDRRAGDERWVAPRSPRHGMLSSRSRYAARRAARRCHRFDVAELLRTKLSPRDSDDVACPLLPAYQEALTQCESRGAWFFAR
jgi:hypothetical protein